jgi:hypothetical protein
MTARGLTLLAMLLTSCYAPGPNVVLIRAKEGTRAEPIQLAEDVWAHIFVPLKDGTIVRSCNKVKLEAGSWNFEHDPKEAKK